MKSNRNTIVILALLALAAIGMVGLTQGQDQPRYEFQAMIPEAEEESAIAMRLQMKQQGS